MKKNSLKYTISVLLCIPAVLAVIIGIKIDPLKLSEGSLKKVSVIAAGENGVPFEQAEDLLFYLGLTERAEPIDHPLRDISEQTPIQVLFFEANSQHTYEFYLTRDGSESYFKNPAGDFSVITQEDSQLLLMREEFASVYPYYHVPAARILSGSGTTELLPNAHTLQYKKIDGQYYDSVAPLYSAADGNKINISGDSSCFLEFDVPPDTMTVKGYRGEELIYEGDFEGITKTLHYSSDTKLVFEVAAEWFEIDETSPYLGEATYQINALYDIPASFRLEDKSLTPGGFTILRATNFNDDEEILIESEMKFASSPVYTYGGEKFMFLSIGCENPAGDYTVRVSGASSDASFPFRIRAKTFPIDTQNVTDPVLKTKNTEETWEEYKEKILPLLSNGENSKLWEGAFVKPVEGKEILTFGTERFVNTITASYRHEAIDIGAPTGTAVKATNSGKVVFTGELALTGNTVVIDHGFGIFSYYAHLNSIDCAAEKYVGKNETIGTVGDTGFALTPQLHFAMSIGETFIDPIYKTGITYPS